MLHSLTIVFVTIRLFCKNALECVRLQRMELHVLDYCGEFQGLVLSLSSLDLCLNQTNKPSSSIRALSAVKDTSCTAFIESF